MLQGTIQSIRHWLFLFLFVNLFLLTSTTFVLVDELEKYALLLVGGNKRHAYRPPLPQKRISAPVVSQFSPEIKDQEAPLPSRKSKPAPGTYPRSLLLDDFINLRINRSGENRREFFSRGATCVAEVLASAAKPNGCLRLQYNVSFPDSSSGYRSRLKGLNLSRYSRLVFRLKRETGEEVFGIGLNEESRECVISIVPFLRDAATDEWQGISIPLSEFDSIQNWTRMNGYIFIVFSNDFGYPYKGSILIKDVMFER